MTKSIPNLPIHPGHPVASTEPLSNEAPHPQSPATITSAPSKTTIKPIEYAKPFCDFLSSNPTVFHAVSALGSQLKHAGFTKLSERDAWSLKKGGKYFVERNGSSLIAFKVGEEYKSGNGFAMIAGHVDALTAKLKPVSRVDNVEGYVRLGVAPYAGGLEDTWWDRDLGIAGRVLVKDSKGKVTVKLVDLHEPIARIATLAPHFGAASQGPFNKETQMVPIIGLDNSDLCGVENPDAKTLSGSLLGGTGSFASTQPPRLVKAVAKELGIHDYADIVNWELELYDIQPATLGGLDKEFIYGGRIDDKLCSWSATQALLASDDSTSPGIVKCVALFDDEEIGSLLRQGANGNFLPSTVERVVDSLADSKSSSTLGMNLISQTYANSMLFSCDVSHAVNSNFMNAYLQNHMPRLNVGVVVSGDSNGHMTTDAVSTGFAQLIAEKCGAKLQVFQIRNDSRSGGTVGPMLSSHMGCRAVDMGQPQLSMHSIRATTGSLDPGLGVQLYKGLFDYYEEVDSEFRDV